MAVIRSLKFNNRWDYTVYHPDSAPSEFAPFESLKSLWDSKRRPGKLPAWRDFEFSDFTGWYGAINVEDIVSRTPYEAVFRLWGSKWVESFGIELTGKPYSALVGNGINSDHIGFWGEMCQTHHIGMGRGSMAWLERTHRNYGKSLWDMCLPLADNGETVDKYMTALYIDSDSVRS